jgi:putative endonuclease
MKGFGVILGRLGLDRTTGPRGERAAARHLRRHGYRLLARNLHSKLGEIDILAEAPDRRTLVVVEVKSAAVDPDTDAPNPPPEVRVNRAKQQKLVSLACHTARRYGLADRPIRFDVIGVDLPVKGKPTIRHHVNAFESHV